MAAQSNEKSKRLKPILNGLISGLLLVILFFSVTRYLAGTYMEYHARKQTKELTLYK